MRVNGPGGALGVLPAIWDFPKLRGAGAQVLKYYARCAKTNNHTVREAACTCIGELAAKVPPDAVAPELPRMLRVLVTCLRDNSWPVRWAPLIVGVNVGFI